ncbi:MAG: glycerate kinase [Clostridiales bacterium]|nr:glycerate kinase [Clostridiales bacterium]
MKVLLVSDSFKGTLTSETICKMAYEAVADLPGAKLTAIPVADGGEGTVSAFIEAIGAEPVTIRVNGPYPDTSVSATYAIKGNTAVIEMASTCGLALLESLGMEKDPFKTTTYGTGELIVDAVKRGCDRVLLGLGGSSTNDGGCGCAAALGIRFYDKSNNTFVPVGGTLKNITHVNTSYINESFHNVTLTLMCDVDNPTVGERGAAFVFASQKGASAEKLIELDEGLVNLCDVIEHDLHKRVDNLLGGGAAGGMGAGCVALLNGRIVSGIDAVLDAVDFESLLADTDLIITGEGRLDTQSLSGKTIAGVSRRIGNKTLIAIVGASEISVEEAAELRLSEIIETGYDGDYKQVFTDTVKRYLCP